MAKLAQFQSGEEALALDGKAHEEDTALLQRLLQRFGHLGSGKYEPGDFCKSTRAAVRRYQRFHGLKVDGIVGPKTKHALLEPRCGLPDEIQSGNFVLRGCNYDTTSLTFAFVNDPSDLPIHEAQEIIREAFAAWSGVSPLRFTEVAPTENPTFRIGWFSGDHSDGSPFDGVGRVIAHAFFPPPCGGTHAGDMHFDEDEEFAASAADGIHLGAVAIHEIGHLLGLGHSDDRQAIMFPTYDPAHLTLGADDIAGIRELYGSPRIVLSGSAEGHLNRRGDEQRFAVDLPAAATIALDGPDDADFDLYVKQGDPPTTSDFDHRAWTVSADETLRVTPAAAGVHHILVTSYRGRGDFTLTVELD
ncbi:MAG: matrixin family metalloprotease [Planctomycetota bacterium]|jgi:hypothetical protein